MYDDVMEPDTTELRKLVTKARRAADGDSNDEEIEALQCALGEALNLLGLSEEEHNIEAAGPMFGELTTEDIECALVTLAELWGNRDADLGEPQTDVADRVASIWRASMAIDGE